MQPQQNLGSTRTRRGGGGGWWGWRVVGVGDRVGIFVEILKSGLRQVFQCGG